MSLDCKFDSNDFLALCKLEREINDVSFERRIKYLIRKRKIKKLSFLNHLNKNQKQRIVNKINEKNFSLKKVLYLLYEFDKELVIDHIIYAVTEKKLTKTSVFNAF